MKISAYYTSLFLLIILFFSCSKDDILDSAQEPLIKDDKNETIVIGDIDVTVDEIRDTDLFLKWHPVGNATSYEIAINDTMTISDEITLNEYSDYYFRLVNLKPYTDYKITLRAISNDLGVKTSTIQTKTKKRFVDRVITFPVDYQIYDPNVGCYYKYIVTADQGAFIAVNLYKYGKLCVVLIKMTKDYQVEWVKEVKNLIPEAIQQQGENFLLDCIQCSDGSFLFIHKQSIYKTDMQGNVIWQYSADFNQDDETIQSTIELPDKNFIIIGYTSKNWGQSNVGIEGLIVKMNPNGGIIWKKQYHSSIENYFQKVLLKPDGNLFIAGTKDVNNADSESLSNIRRSICMFEINQNGDIQKELVYQYQHDPYLENVSLNNLISYNGYYYLVGRAIYDYYNTFLTKIDSNGSIIWQRRGHEDGEYSSYISLSGISNKSIYMYSYINSQYSLLKEIDLDGNIVKEVPFRKFPGGYPNGIYCGQDKEGRFVYVAENGLILLINLDGYRYE